MPSVPRKVIEESPAQDETVVEALPAPASRTTPAVAPIAEPSPEALPVRKVSLPVVEAVRVATPAVSSDESKIAPLVEKAMTRRVSDPKPRTPKARKKPSDYNDVGTSSKVMWCGEEVRRDWLILDVLYRYKLLTTNHIAYLLDISPDSARKRMTALAKAGYVRHDNRKGPRVWQITNDGIARIGKKNKAKAGVKFPSILTYPHTLSIATVGITLEKGGPAAAKLVGNLLSEAPRIIVTEREMQSTEALRGGRDFLFQNFDRLIGDLMLDEKFPVYPYECVMSNERFESWSEQDFANMFAHELADRKMLDARFRGTDKDDKFHLGYSHLVTSHNPNLETNRSFGGKSIQGKSVRRPDALIVLPHIINADGTVSGGSVAIEVELNNKASLTEYKNIILHQYSHKVYSRVFWFFDDADAKDMFARAMDELAQSHNAPFTLAEAKRYFKPLAFHMLNEDLDMEGLYG
jgi:hypothetical protein